MAIFNSYVSLPEGKTFGKALAVLNSSSLGFMVELSTKKLFRYSSSVGLEPA